MMDEKMDANIDAALGIWARDDRVESASVERLTQRIAQIPTQPMRRWLPWAAGGGAIAASLAVALLFALPGETPAVKPAETMVAAAPETGPTGQESFFLLYTPTADEEQFI